MEELYTTLSRIILSRVNSNFTSYFRALQLSIVVVIVVTRLEFGRFKLLFRQIFWVAIALIAILFFKEYIGFYVEGMVKTDTTVCYVYAQKTPLELINRMLQVITPFLYGAIGSLVYVYKSLSDLYVSRTPIRTN
ncbi:MAG: hypothetical protein R3E08_14125 [Thiotrichaceae bacterium]